MKYLIYCLVLLIAGCKDPQTIPKPQAHSANPSFQSICLENYYDYTTVDTRILNVPNGCIIQTIVLCKNTHNPTVTSTLIPNVKFNFKTNDFEPATEYARDYHAE